MKTPDPTIKDIDDLLTFKPLLYSHGPPLVIGTGGGKDIEEGVMTLPFPIYNDVVIRFFGTAAQECWMDHEYDPPAAREMLHDQHMVDTAGIDHIKTMLTYCVRGERFCDGFWANVIQEGHVRRLLERLETLRCEMADKAS